MFYFLFNNFRQWADDRGIYQYGTIPGQYKKLGEEFGELIAGQTKNDKDEIADAIGDMIVVLTHIAHMNDLAVEDCMAGAWEEIKDRKGQMMPDGTFKKETK